MARPTETRAMAKAPERRAMAIAPERRAMALPMATSGVGEGRRPELRNFGVNIADCR